MLGSSNAFYLPFLFSLFSSPLLILNPPDQFRMIPKKKGEKGMGNFRIFLVFTFTVLAKGGDKMIDNIRDLPEDDRKKWQSGEFIQGYALMLKMNSDQIVTIAGIFEKQYQKNHRDTIKLTKEISRLNDNIERVLRVNEQQVFSFADLKNRIESVLKSL